MAEFDYIIVGAGSAGCVLASRLTEDPETKVLLIEAGGSDRSIFIQMPTALSIPMNTQRFNWQFESEPEPFMDNRRLHCPRGKVIGGSSSINGMVYVRGHACDFDEWEEEGAAGWGYRHVLPYFRRAETWKGGADDYRGGEGPLAVCAGNEMRLNPLYEAFIKAGIEAGYPATADYNGERQEGFGQMHMTVKDGVRASTANAYLKPALGRPNLVLAARCAHQAHPSGGQDGGRGRVPSGRQDRDPVPGPGGKWCWRPAPSARPACCSSPASGRLRCCATREWRWCTTCLAWARTCKTTWRSTFQYQCSQPITLNAKLGPLSKGLIGARWILFKDGLGATNHFESCAFIRSKAGQRWPDIQYHFLPAAMRYDGNAAFEGHGFQVHVGPNKPKSRGHVRIMSNDPRQKPSILFNYLAHEDDRADWRAAIRLTREILGQPALDPYRGAEIQPGDRVTGGRRDRCLGAGQCRERLSRLLHLQDGDGADDPMAVVDPDCRVLGIERLRLADSSIFPTIPNGNLNAPSIMVGEKAADHIRGKPLLAASNAPVWIDPDWETKQRRRGAQAGGGDIAPVRAYGTSSSLIP